LSPRLQPIRADGDADGHDTSFTLKPTVFVLSRAICSFSRVRISGKGAKARAAARLSVAYRQGYADPQTRLMRDPQDPLQAGVWSWDGAFSFNNGAAADFRVLPETLAREGLDDGARLARCIDGFEGQVWRNSALIASRWWPRSPTPREWQHFIRAAQAPMDLANGETPKPVDVPFRGDLPLLDMEPASLKLTFAPARLAGGAAGLIAMVAAFQAAQLITHKGAAAAANNRIEAALNENNAAIEARRNALTAQERVAELAKFGRTDLVARAFHAVAQEIPADTARISNFRVNDRAIEARVQVSNDAVIDIPDLVSRLEKNTILTEVFVEQRNARLIDVSASFSPDSAGDGDALTLRD